jgi:hypothetical protein
MTLRSLLTLQMVFLLAGTSSPGRPAALGVVVEAYRAHLGGSAVSPGATVYDGDHFSTEEGGALWLRCNAALLEVGEKSAVLVRRVGNETQDGEAEAELVEGTLVFSTARAGALEVQAREAHIGSAGARQTVAQVSVIGPKELRIYARRGAVLFSYRGESRTIAEGESYQVILDPAEDGSAKKQVTPSARRPPKAFLLVAVGAGSAAAAAVTVYEKHQHKHMESPDHP